jgi:hypothetical protein
MIQPTGRRLPARSDRDGGRGRRQRRHRFEATNPWLLALLLVVVLALALAIRGLPLAGAWGIEQTGPS